MSQNLGMKIKSFLIASLAAFSLTAGAQSTFTSDSIKGLNLLLNAGSGSARDFRDQLKDCGGSAEEMAKKMNDNLQGDILACQSALESMQIAVGEKLDPVLRKRPVLSFLYH